MTTSIVLERRIDDTPDELPTHAIGVQYDEEILDCKITIENTDGGIAITVTGSIDTAARVFSELQHAAYNLTAQLRADEEPTK